MASGFAVAGIVVGLVIAGLIGLGLAQDHGLVERPTDYQYATSGQDIDEANTARLVQKYVNEERQRAGVTPLVWNDELASVALAHSKDMAEKSYFDHVNMEGKSNMDRFNDADLDCRITFPDRTFTNGSENLVQGGSRYGQQSEDAIAKGSVQAWMASTAGHRENMLAGYWASAGVGIAFNTEGDTAYIVQTFCP